MALVSEIWKSMVLFPRSLFIGGFHHQQRKGQIWGRNLGGCISDSSLGVFRIRQVSFYMEDFTSSTTMSFISWPPPAHWVAPSTKTADDCCTWNCPPAYAALAPLPLPLPLLSPEPSPTLTRPLSLYTWCWIWEKKKWLKSFNLENWGQLSTHFLPVSVLIWDTFLIDQLFHKYKSLILTTSKCTFLEQLIFNFRCWI